MMTSWKNFNGTIYKVKGITCSSINVYMASFELTFSSFYSPFYDIQQGVRTSLRHKVSLCGWSFEEVFESFIKNL